VKFTHLHVHSHYSLLDGLPKIDELIARAKELGMDSIALTDHGSLYGVIEFYKKAKAAGIKPIIGVETYVTPNRMHDKRPNIDTIRYHLILLAKNNTGYKNLIKLVTLSHLEGFYYKPRIDKETLKKYSEGLIGLSSCLQGEISRIILGSNETKAKAAALQYQDIFGKGNFFLELQHHPNIPEQKTLNNRLKKLAKETSIPLVATHDLHYLNPKDAKAQDVLMLVNTGADPNNPERLTLQGEDFSMRSPAEMEESFRDCPEAIENTEVIAKMCNAEIQLGQIKLPQFKVPGGKAPDEYLRELCAQGLERRYQEKKNSPEIIKRLDYELDVIKKTGFASYFLIVQDFVNWAKSQEIVVGPGRGSAAGSIVAYLLNITNIDPIKYNLLFERFLNQERISLPDIDLDFTDVRRGEVIEYVSQKYGRDNVAQIITFGTMAARASIRDVTRALNHPYALGDRIAKMIPFQFKLKQALDEVIELKQAYDTEPEVREIITHAMKLEGVARHASTHACGVVITKEPMDTIVPRQHASQSDQTIITQYEMHAIEDLGLLKMDFLGLKNLTIIENAINILKATRGISIDLEEIPMDDKATYDLFQRGQTTGIFQYESQGMQRYLKELVPTVFEDLISMVALFRPGPMDSIQTFIDAKHKRREITYLHPKLKPILESSYGVIVTQEQVLEIAKQLAGFSYAQADILRKAVGKKIRSLLEEQRGKLIEGMAKNGIEEHIAARIWDFIEPFARYGFNRAHAACYALIGYQTAYLKTNYPIEFMTALMNSEQRDVERIAVLIQECKQMGIKVLAPDVNESKRNFTIIPGKNQIRFGLLAIKNVGENIVEAITQERKVNGPFVSVANFTERIQCKDLNKKKHGIPY